MSRLVLALVVALAAPACSKGGGDAASQVATSGQGAGKVLEVGGTVTVKGKALAVGVMLQADDVVETGADGHVVIELVHNLAHWELGPSKQQKLSDSIAWKVPKNEGNSQVVIRDMSAAGRPAERSAADTAASAPAPPAAEAAPAPAAQPAPVAAAAPSPSPKAAAPMPPPPPPPPAPAPADEPRTRGGRAKASASASASGGGGGALDVQASAVAATGSTSAADLIERQEPALRKCLAPGALVKIHVVVDAAGKATTTIDGAASGTVASCLKAVIGKLKLPAEKSTVNMTIEHATK